MQNTKIITILFSFLIILVLSGTAKSSPAGSAAAGYDMAPAYLLLLLNSAPGAIVVDHRHTDISQIPNYWIMQARKLVVHYAHTSHGGQVLSGLYWLENRDSKYNVTIEASGTVVLPADPSTDTLRIYDGNNYPGDTYITPEQYW